MKKTVHIAAALLICATTLLVSCKTTPVAINESGPIAIISVTGNPALPWEKDDNDDEGDDGNGVLSTLVNKLVDGKNPELSTGVDRLDYAVDSFHALIEEIATVEVIDDAVLKSAENYVSINENIFNLLESTIGATGFKKLNAIGGKRARLLMQEIGAKSLIFADFDFRKTVLSGSKWNGSIAPMLTMKVHLVNERGKEVINRSFTLKGSDSVRSSGKNYDRDALVGLYPALIDNAISQFVVSYLQ